MARNMVTKYGMSDAVGPVYHSNGELDKLSAPTREHIEQEVRALLMRAEANARRLLTDNSAELHKLAQGLLEHETLSIADINNLLEGRKLSFAKPKGGAEKPTGAVSS